MARRRGMGCGIALGAAFVVLILAIIGVASTGNTTQPTAGLDPVTTETTAPTVEQPAQTTPAPTVAAATPVPTTAPAPTGPVSSFTDGTYVVGTDILAGTYKSTGPSDTGGICTWFRLKDTTGNDGSIIALDVSKGPATVTVARTDGALKTSGCVTWRKVN